jgi:heptosyltransferase-1
MERPLLPRTIAPGTFRLEASGEKRPLRVLIVRIGAMGDVLHAMPAVSALRELHPDCFIGWAIEPRWSELLQSGADFARVGTAGMRSTGKPLVDVWFPMPTRRWKKQPFAAKTIAEIRAARQDLRAGNFDVCVDMQGSIKSAVVGRIARAKVLSGAVEPRERQAAWLYGERFPLHAQHVIEQGCELLGAALGETLQPARVALPVDDAAERWCDEALANVSPPGEPFVLIAPAAGWGAKQWPAMRFGEVAAELGRAGFRTAVNAASFGDAVALRVVEASGDAAKLAPCSVGQMIALVRRAALVIAGDTGPLHLAATLSRPVVALFGPTDPARNGPFGTRAAVLRHASSQRNHRRRNSPDAGLMQISVDEVVKAALSLLQRKPEGEQDKVGG